MTSYRAAEYAEYARCVHLVDVGCSAWREADAAQVEACALACAFGWPTHLASVATALSPLHIRIESTVSEVNADWIDLRLHPSDCCDNTGVLLSRCCGRHQGDKLQPSRSDDQSSTVQVGKPFSVGISQSVGHQSIGWASVSRLGISHSVGHQATHRQWRYTPPRSRSRHRPIPRRCRPLHFSPLCCC